VKVGACFGYIAQSRHAVHEFIRWIPCYGSQANIILGAMRCARFFDRAKSLIITTADVIAIVAFNTSKVDKDIQSDLFAQGHRLHIPHQERIKS